MFLSCFENCARNMMILERVAYRRGERDTYMNTIEVIIDGSQEDQWGESIEESNELLQEEPRHGKRVRFRRVSGASESGGGSGAVDSFVPSGEFVDVEGV